MKIIGITGTPGTGKKTISLELAKKLNFQHINLNDYAIKNKLTKNNKTDHIIYDLNLFTKKIKKSIENENFIISGHLLPDIISKKDVDIIFILRCSPLILLKRYKTGSIVPIITAGKIEYSPPNILDITVIRIAVTDIIMITGKYFFICFISILNDLF